MRNRESFIQVTNTDNEPTLVHVQIYNVANLCNENNFFDIYTPNDTHVYNLRNILSNDSNPSGVVLPDDAYGIVFISAAPVGERLIRFYTPIVGNFRIVDNSGYEYRSNAQSLVEFRQLMMLPPFDVITFNYNSEKGVVLSDVFGIPLSADQSELGSEGAIDNVLNTFVAVDVDIIDVNEVLFSCRDVVFACIDDNSPLIEELLQLANNSNIGPPIRSSASVAAFEYGINEVIPNSKDGELLCPGNVISEGVVRLTLEGIGDETFKTCRLCRIKQWKRKRKVWIHYIPIIFGSFPTQLKIINKMM